MEIERKEKIEILLTMIKENNIQIIWMKDLDFKIAYYTTALLFGTLAWLAASSNNQLMFLHRYFSIIMLVFSSLFLARNHVTHSRIRANNRRMLKALGLFSKNTYGQEPAVTYATDLTFFMGRFLYFIVLIVSSGASILASCYLYGLAK